MRKVVAHDRRHRSGEAGELGSLQDQAPGRVMFADRFTGAGWTFPEQLFKDVIREAAEGKEASKIATTAFRLLRNIPDRKTKWREAGENWNALVNSVLNDDALKQWTHDKFLASNFGPTED